MAVNLDTAYASTLTSNVRWGRHAGDVLDWFKNPAGGTGPKGTGRPVLLYRHTAGGSKNEFYGGAGQVMYRITDYLLGGLGNAPSAGTRAVAFDVISIETPQRSQNTPTPQSRTVYWPSQVYEYQHCTQMVRAMAADFGCDPNLIVHSGSSWGSMLALQACMLQPAFGQGGVGIDRRGIFETRGWSAIPKALFLIDSVLDWRKLATANGITFSGATWIEGTKTITSAGAFTNYRWASGDQARVTSVTSGTTGLYPIASSTADTLVLTTSIGTSASNVAGQVPTDQIDLGTAVGLFGHNHVNDSTWDALPVGMRNAASPRFWAEQHKVSRVPSAYFQGTLVGTGLTPYGAAWRGANATVHDPQQAIDMSAALIAAGRSSQFNYTLRTSWNGGTVDAGLTTLLDSKRIYDWLVARIMET